MASCKDSADNALTSYSSLSESERKQEGKDEGKSKAIKLVKKERSLVNRIFRLCPTLASNNVFKLFGVVLSLCSL
jgi:hypothetical protein